MEDLTFFHAADLHLGAVIPVKNHWDDRLIERIHKSTNRAVIKMVDHAIREKIDFLLLSGDIFDKENRSIKAQRFLKNECQRLQEYGIQVYMIFGNHDPVESRYAPVGWPENVHIFKDQPMAIPYRKSDVILAQIYGFSYPKRAVSERMVTKYEKVKTGRYHIAMLHGEERGLNEYSSYAPFTKQQLIDKKMDYWALGHVHSFEKVIEKGYYPGNIQGRHHHEKGEKGYVKVNMKNGYPYISFCPAGPIRFETIHISINEMKTWDHIERQLWKKLESFMHPEQEGCIADIILEGSGPMSEIVSNQNELQAWIESWDEDQSWRSPFLFIWSVKNDIQPEWSRDAFLEKNDFIGDIFREAEEVKKTPAVLHEIWKDLLNHPRIKSGWINWSEEEMKGIVEEAERIIADHWVKEEDG